MQLENKSTFVGMAFAGADAVPITMHCHEDAEIELFVDLPDGRRKLAFTVEGFARMVVAMDKHFGAWYDFQLEDLES